MAAIRAYTTIEQSKVLAERLPLESADMYYELIMTDDHEAHYKIPQVRRDVQKSSSTDIPCWSLTALLEVLPNENMLVKTTDKEYYCLAKDIMTKHYNNPIDDCYEMVLELKRKELL